MRTPDFFRTKLFKRIIILLTSLFFLLIVFFFLFRNAILHSVLEKKIIAFNAKYPATLVVRDSHFTGISGIDMEGICIVPKEKDTLINLEEVHAGLKLIPMLFGVARLDALELNNGSVHLVSENGADNYSFLLKKEKSAEKNESGYATAIDKLSNAVFGVIPDDMSVNGISIHASVDSSVISAYIDGMEMKDHHFLCPLKLIEDGKPSLWKIKGTIDKDSRIAGFMICPEKEDAYFPYLKNMFGLAMKIDSIGIGLADNTYRGEIYHLSSYASAYGLLLNHKKISTSDVEMKNALLKFNFNIGKDFIELDSTSSLLYNSLELNPYVLFQSDTSKKITFKIRNEFDAQDLFGSLPAGLFKNFEGIRTSGRLCFSVDFFVDMNQPDSLEFTASLMGKDFQVLKYGMTDFSMMVAPFTYTAYENEYPVAAFLVGPDNPDFTPIEDISLPLKEAVIIAENGGTYFQTGFDINSLRLAIIQDIKEKKFVRGGSTIEMQLVKNVFLTKNKTIARKLEELLIVWLIESGNLCSHDRMFEIYLNIAEWGPLVYGIKQAASFYFNKSPDQLSVPESIFLASILPRPKWYKYAFNKEGDLDAAMNQAYYSSIASLLVERGTISPGDTINMLQNVKLCAASKMLMMQDTSYFDVDELPGREEEYMGKSKTGELRPLHNSGENKKPGNKEHDLYRRAPGK